MKWALLTVVLVTVAAVLFDTSPPALAPEVMAAELPPPSGALSPAPLNNDFTAGEPVVSAPPNYGFEDGLTDWTVEYPEEGTVTTPSGGQSGSYLQIEGSANLKPRVVSSAFTIDSSAPTWSFYVNTFGDGTAQYNVWIATAPDYTNWTQISGGSSSVDGWQRVNEDLSSYVGQSVKIQYRAYKTVGFDEGATRKIPNWSVGGAPAWESNVSFPATTPGLGDFLDICTGGAVGGLSGPAVKLAGNASILSEPFTIPGDSARTSFRILGTGFGPAATITLYLASEGYSNPHVVFDDQFEDGDSFFTMCDLSEWAGENAKMKIASSFGGAIEVQGGGVTWSSTLSLNPDESEDPVSLVSGVLTHQHTDLVIPGKGVPLEFTRFYSSAGSAAPGSLGWGWRHNYDAELIIFNSGDVGVEYPDGARAYFTEDSGTFTPPQGIHDTLEKNPDDTYTLTTTSQIEFNFDTGGKLTSIADRNDNTTTVAYDVDGYLSTVTDPGGRQLTFTVDANGRITQITDPLSRTVGFTYDANGDLVTVTDVKDGTSDFTYSNHRLTTITDSLDQLQVTNTYDDANRVVEQVDAVDGVTCFYYGHGPSYTSENCPGVSPAPQAGETVMVDRRGNKQLHQFDTSFRPTAIQDALGNVPLFTYEAPGALCSPANDGNLCSVTDPLDHTASFTYDASGNVLTVTDALSNTWTYTYNSFNDVLTEEDPLERTTTYGYDEEGNLTSVTNALEEATSFTHNDDGTLASLTDALSHTTSFGYDQYGNHTSVTDPLDNTMTFTYDLGGRLLTETDALDHTTTYTYDNQNNVLTVTDELDNVTTYAYDAKGQRTSVTDANDETTSFAYDEAGRLTTVTDTLSQTVTYGYDANGNRTSMTNTRDKNTTYEYDALNRLTSVTDPLDRETTYAYDAAGRRTSRTDAESQTTTYTYNAVNRLTGIDYPVGTPDMSFTYDDLGNRLTVVDGTGTTSYSYDALYRLTSVEDGAEDTVSYDYDYAGRLTSITYPGGQDSVTYGYDDANRLTSVTDWLNNTTSYTYDTAGRLTSTSLPNGLTSDRTHDNADRLLTVVNRNGETTISSFSYTLDAVGNRTQVVDDTGVTDYAYDDLYRLRTVINLQSQLDTYSYDEMGNRLTRRANPYQYDDADEMLSAFSLADTDGDGCVDEEELPGALSPKPGSTGSYDPLDYWDFYDVPVPAVADPTPNGPKNRAVAMDDVMAVLFYTGTSATEACGDNPNTNGVDYDCDKGMDTDGDTVADIPPDGVPDGRDYDRSPSAEPNPPWDVGPPNDVIAMDDVLAVLAQSGLSCADPPNEEPVTYGYDANGNLTGRGDDTFAWDAENRLVSTNIGDTSGSYAYNGDGLRVSRNIGGAAVSYTWDVNRGLPVILEDSDGNRYVYGLDLLSATDNSSTQTYFLYDGLASTTELSDDEGTVTGTYEYDVFGSVRAHSGAATEWSYTGEQNDPTGLEYLRARYYDPAGGRFLSRDPLGGLPSDPQSQNRYVYVSNNCINYVDPSGLVGLGPPPPAAKQVCVSWIEVWDLRGGLGLFPTLKLFRFELHALYYRNEAGQIYLHTMWADETHLGAGWHIDRSSLEFGSKEGGGAMARARFGAGGVNPFGFWPLGFNADVVLRQWIDVSAGEIIGSESRDINPTVKLSGLKTKSGRECRGWH